MRQIINPQMQFGETDVSQIELDKKSRDDIPKLLAGLKYIYTTKEIRDEVFRILEEGIKVKRDLKNGRPGMELWKILVLGSLRLDINCDYDRLQELANNHKTLRQIMGHGMKDNNETYNIQTLKDNVALITEEILNKINQVIVVSGHKIVKKNDEILKARCDSFVLETDVHFPTDINLLYDAIRKTMELTARICEECGKSGWRQTGHNIRKFKKVYRRVQKIRHSNSKNAEKLKVKEEEIKKEHRAYIDLALDYLMRVKKTISEMIAACEITVPELTEIIKYKAHAERQINQIERRVINGEKIPQEEKVFSIFEEHTEWICKGKAGKPFELGLRVCILEDQFGFLLYQHVMEKQTDDKVAVFMIEEGQKKFEKLKSCSFDKGFYSPANRMILKQKLASCVLPKKGKSTEAEKEIENSEEYKRARNKHSAVESGINALEVHGLDRCPDHGLERFKKYVALAVLSRNIQKLGEIVLKRELIKEKKRLARLKNAA